MNVWINENTGHYHIRYQGKEYVRVDLLAAKDLIDGFLCEETIAWKNRRLDRTLYAA